MVPYGSYHLMECYRLMWLLFIVSVLELEVPNTEPLHWSLTCVGIGSILM